MKQLVLVLVSSVFVACASTSSYIGMTKKKYPKKSDNCKIDVMMEDPSWAHEKLGLITAVSGQAAFAGKDLRSMLPAMKEKACRIGADAIVLRNVEEGGVAWVAPTQGKASGVAIKYLSEPSEPVPEIEFETTQEDEENVLKFQRRF